ncbi:serine/threonine-protein kinase PknK [Vitiosangium sp. GDMCC 1.1324]|uniref:serine/threonine-protein kinase n=1 Tax=Vitiosangium sp. (strain GDMCC 1.1324) TaxID=2138576 RepID=UPI000D38B440|nr:protein kinase [Vitiosangium sp. GDMCC 1.1324]PTL83932.1 serine/threonine-protein kinase PknK [Vitiosangium sp. GDMCC 1.1324]
MPRCLSCGRRWENTHPQCPDGRHADQAIITTTLPSLPALAIPGYALERTIARGGFGTLLAARRQSDGLRVAIKLAHGTSSPGAGDLGSEAEALRAIGPPTVPEVYETGLLSGGRPYLVMQLIPHPTLAARMARQAGPLPEAGRYGMALVEALATVHRRGFLHCDLKPENLFLDEVACFVGLFDFGLARRLSADARGEAPGAGLDCAGTAEYMAPEQCAGDGLPDERTDVYAAGVLLYEMLTGRPPFFGAPVDVLQAHLSRRPPRPSELAEVPAALEEVVLRCLDKERPRRYASARELGLALRRALEQPALAPAAPQRPPSPPSSSAPVELRSVALLYLRSGANPLTLQKALALDAGHLCFHDGTRFAAVFDPESAADPLRAVRLCAERLCAEGLASTALVDVATVRVLRRPQGPPRYLSATFAHPARYPAPEGPASPLLTAASVALLPEGAYVPVPEREGLFRRAPPSADQDASTTVHFHHSVLVGRLQELEELLRGACSAVRERAATLATVLGERGQGKSHLASALLQYLHERVPEARVATLRARPPAQGEPQGTLRQLLRGVLSAWGGEPAGGPAEWRARGEELLGPELARELWPAMHSCLGGHSPTGEELRPFAAAPGALRSLLVRATGELLLASARARPLLLLLDDAHFAEDAALDALEYATRAGTALPLWVCVLARPGFEEGRPHWARRATHHPLLRLGPLSPANAVELCRTALLPAENVPTEALERLAERAQRVPLFLIELVRGLKRLGLVRQRPAGSWYLATDEVERMPELHLVEWLTHQELRALPAELTAHARLCALLGGDFTLEEVEGVVDELVREGAAADFPLDARHASRRLVELGLLVAPSPDCLCFRNELMREVVARGLSELQRRQLHRAAHRYYLGLLGRPRLPQLAYHAAAAGLREEASVLYLDLAESARGRHAYLEAEATYSRALELLPDTDAPRCLIVLRGRGLMRYRVGRYEDSLADFAHARELARRLGQPLDEVEVLLDEATALDWTNDYVRAAERIHQAVELTRTHQLDTSRLRARLSLGMGLIHFRQGQWAEARVQLEAAALLARPQGDAGHETLVISLLLLGVILPNLGCIDETHRVMEECIAACTERGDRLHLGSALNNRRNLWVARNEPARAREDQQCFMRLGRELGMVGWEYFAEHNLGELYYQEGDIQKAEPHIARAVELERNHPEVASRPWGLLLQARVLAYQGHEVRARQSLRLLRQALMERPGVELSPSESVQFSLVELATRPARAEEWRELQERSDTYSMEQEPLEVLEVQALARLRRGERQQAIRLLTEALRRAEQLPNIMRSRLRRSLERALAEEKAASVPWA